MNGKKLKVGKLYQTDPTVWIGYEQPDGSNPHTLPGSCTFVLLEENIPSPYGVAYKVLTQDGNVLFLIFGHGERIQRYIKLINQGP